MRELSYLLIFIVVQHGLTIVEMIEMYNFGMSSNRQAVDVDEPPVVFLCKNEVKTIFMMLITHGESYAKPSVSRCNDLWISQRHSVTSLVSQCGWMHDFS